MIKIIRRSYLEDHWKRYPETEEVLKAWMYKIQDGSYESSKDFLNDFPKTALIGQGALNFQVTPSVFLLASFHAVLKVLVIRGIGTLYSSSSSNLALSHDLRG